MRGKLVDFCSALRFNGVPVSVPEALGAASVFISLDDPEKPTIEEKETIRLTLQACMLKEEVKAPIFNEQFERWWTRWYGTATSDLSLSDLVTSLRQSILQGNQDEFDLLFHQAVARVREEMAEEASDVASGQGVGAGGGEGLGAVLGEQRIDAVRRSREQRAIYNYIKGILKFEELSDEVNKDPNMSFWQREIAVHSLREAETALRSHVYESGYNMGDSNVRNMQRRMEEAYEDVSDLAISQASVKQQEKMREIVPDIVRKLSNRQKYKDHDSKGVLQLRKTMRSSLSNGGVPVDVIFKRKMPRKERIAVLCDLSGSVEVFSQFALQLANLFSNQFAGVQCYGFISDIDDITRFVSRDDFPHSMKGLYAESELILGTQNSNYGQVFQQFVRKHLTSLPRSSSVLILGDARNNLNDPGLESLREIRNWVKNIYWLNPEPISSWGAGDSEMRQYAQFCESSHHIESVNDLAVFLANLRGY